MLYLTCTTITSVDLAHYGVSCAKDLVSVDCGTKYIKLTAVTLNTIWCFFVHVYIEPRRRSGSG